MSATGAAGGGGLVAPKPRLVIINKGVVGPLIQVRCMQDEGNATAVCSGRMTKG